MVVVRLEAIALDRGLPAIPVYLQARDEGDGHDIGAAADPAQVGVQFYPLQQAGAGVAGTPAVL